MKEEVHVAFALHSPVSVSQVREVVLGDAMDADYIWLRISCWAQDFKF